jgi:hypothetical protein
LFRQEFSGVTQSAQSLDALSLPGEVRLGMHPTIKIIGMSFFMTTS